VFVPFLGLIAISLYQGDYYAFFARLGKIPAFMVITLLMIVLGPLGGMPRTETTTFNTLLPYLPDPLKNNMIFSLLYFSVVLLLAYRESKVIKILGLFLSPVKIICFSCLVFFGLWYRAEPIASPMVAKEAFWQAVSLGNISMDLLAGFFFCSMAFRSIESVTKTDPTLNATKLTLKACAIGAALIGLVYSGFMLVAYHHAAQLQGLGAEEMISVVSEVVLGRFGSLFVCIAVSFACIATTLALGQICTQCLYQDILKTRVSKKICFGLVIVSTYLMSNLGFQGILKITLPIVNAIYPGLIVLCIFTIWGKYKQQALAS
jgi:LIVCS family branched-chain amino acid:cation transporter